MNQPQRPLLLSLNVLPTPLPFFLEIFQVLPDWREDGCQSPKYYSGVK